MSNTTDDMEAFHRGAKFPGAPCPFPAGSRAAHWFQLGQKEPQRPPQEPPQPWNEPAPAKPPPAPQHPASHTSNFTYSVRPSRGRHRITLPFRRLPMPSRYWLLRGPMALAGVAGLCQYGYHLTFTRCHFAYPVGSVQVNILRCPQPSDFAYWGVAAFTSAALLAVSLRPRVGMAGWNWVKSQFSPPQPPPQPSLLHRANLLSGQGLPVGLHAVIDNAGRLFPDYPLTYPGDRHSAIFGPIGSGKFRDLQASTALTYPGSLLVLDLKGQIWATCREARRALGHTIKTINPDGIFNQPSCTYNPLRFLDPAKPSFMGQVQRIVEGFIPAGEGSGKFFAASAEDYTMLLIAWIVCKRGNTQWPFVNNKPSPPDMSLNRLWELLCLPEGDRMALMDVVAQCDFKPVALAAPRYGIGSKGSKEVQDCVSTARVECRVLNDPAVAAVLRDSPDNLSFADMKRHKETVHIMVPPHMIQARAKFMRLMVMCAFNELIEETANPPGGRVLFMLDEFAQLGPMPLVENSASIIRDYKIALQVVLQNRGQIDDLYGENRAESFLSSAGIVQVLTPNDMKTAEWLSRRSGVKLVPRTTFTTGQGNSYGMGAQSTGNSSQSSGTSTQMVEEPNWKPHEILELQDDHQLLVVPGVAQLIRVARKPYYRLPHLRAAAAPDPYHMSDDMRARFEAECKAGRYDYSKPA